MRPRTEWWLLAGALFAAPFVASYFAYGIWPSEGTEMFTGLFSGSVPELGHFLVAVLLLSSFVVSAWRMAVYRLPHWPMLLVFLLFWALLALSGAGTRFPATVSAELVRWFACVCALLVVTGVCGRGRLALALGGAIALAAGLEALWAVRQYLATFREVPNWRVFGTFFSPSFLASYLVLTAPLCLVFFVRAQRTVAWFAGLLCLLVVSALVLTGSRGGLLSFGVAVLGFWGFAVWNRRADKALWIRSVPLVAASVVLVFLLRAVGGPARVVAGSGNSEGHSAAFRLHLWQDTIRMVEQRPLQGFGLGTFSWARGPYSSVGFTRLAHNSYLQVASEAGIPTLVCFLVFGAFWFRAVGAREAKPVPDEDRFLGVDRPLLRSAVLGGVSGFATHNLVDSALYLFSASMTFWAILGLGLAIAVDGSVPVHIPKRSLGIGATVFAVILAGALGARAVAACFAVSGQAALEGGTYWQARERFETAVAWAPSERRYRIAAGKLALASGERRAAEVHFAVVRRQEPSAEALTAIGLAYSLAGDDQAASASFAAALRADPYAAEALRGMLRVMRRTSSPKLEGFARGIVRLRQSTHAKILAVPEVVETVYAEADTVLGASEDARGNSAEALSHYRRAFEDLTRFLRVTYPMVLVRGMYGPVHEERAKEILSLYFETLSALSRLAPPSVQAEVAGTARETADLLKESFERAGRPEEWEDFVHRSGAAIDGS